MFNHLNIWGKTLDQYHQQWHVAGVSRPVDPPNHPGRPPSSGGMAWVNLKVEDQWQIVWQKHDENRFAMRIV